MVLDELKGNDRNIVREKLRGLYLDSELSDEFLDGCVDLYKVAINIGLDPRKLLDSGIDKYVSSKQVLLSNIGYTV